MKLSELIKQKSTNFVDCVYFREKKCSNDGANTADFFVLFLLPNLLRLISYSNYNFGYFSAFLFIFFDLRILRKAERIEANSTCKFYDKWSPFQFQIEIFQLFLLYG